MFERSPTCGSLSFRIILPIVFFVCNSSSIVVFLLFCKGFLVFITGGFFRRPVCHACLTNCVQVCEAQRLGPKTSHRLSELNFKNSFGFCCARNPPRYPCQSCGHTHYSLRLPSFGWLGCKQSLLSLMGLVLCWPSCNCLRHLHLCSRKLVIAARFDSVSCTMRSP